MENKNQLPKISVNIEKLDDRLHDPRFIQVKQDAQGKELVLFLGATGAGKSTCINYLLGAKIDRDIDGSGATIAKLGITQDEPIIDKRFANISPGNRQPCTLYSEIFYDSTLDMAYCDTAGVLSPSGTANELQICASLSMQYAIQSAKSIKAIVIVVEWYIFLTQTPLELYALTFLLTQLLVEPEKNTNSIIFLINRVPKNIKKQNVAYAISCYKNILTQDIEMITNKTYSCSISASDLEERKRVARMINLLDTQIKEKPENIILMDVFDEGQTRQTIHALLKEKKSLLAKEHFSFGEYNEKRKAFDSEIDIIAPLVKEYRQQKKSQAATVKEDNDSHFFMEAKTLADEKVPKTVAIILNDVFHNETSTTQPDANKRSETCSMHPDNASNHLGIHETEKVIALNDPDNEDSRKNVFENSEDTTKNSSPVITHNSQEDLTGLLFHLTKTANPQKKITDCTVTISEDKKITETPQSLQNYPDESQITSSNLAVSPKSSNFKYMRWVLMIMAGISCGLFGIFLLGTVFFALMHSSLAISIVQALFKLALDESIASTFICGVLSTAFGVATVYIASVIFPCEKSKMVINVAEDPPDTNRYSTLSLHQTSNQKSSAPLLAPERSGKTESVATQNNNSNKSVFI